MTKKKSPFKRWMRRLFQAFGLAILFSTTAATFFWMNGTLFSWARKQAIQIYAKYVAPRLPFEIEKIDARGQWKDIFQGHLDHLELDLKWQGWRLSVRGPIKLHRNAEKKEVQVSYHLTATLEPLFLKHSESYRSPPIPILVELKGSESLVKIQEMHAQIDLPKYKWDWTGSTLQSLKANLEWKEGSPMNVRMTIPKIEWSAPRLNQQSDIKNAANISWIDLQTVIPFKLNPLPEVGNQIQFSMKMKDAEVLWKGTYLDLPLKLFPISGQLNLEQDISSILKIGSARTKQAEVDLTLHSSSSGIESIDVEWFTPHWALSEMLDLAIDMTKSTGGDFNTLKKLKKAKYKSGTFRTQGEASIPLNPFSVLSPSFKAEGNLQIENLSFKWPKWAFAVRNFNLLLPFSAEKTVRGSVSAENLYYKRFQGSLSHTPLSLSPQLSASERRLLVRIGNNQTLPLIIDGVPLQVGKIVGNVGLNQQNFLTSLNVDRMDLDQSIHGFCLDEVWIPPISVSARFPRIEFSPDSVVLQGDAHAYLFNGSIDVDNISLSDLDTSLPQLDFNADFRNIRLDTLGDWSGLGKMDGKIEGHARDVTLRSWIPIRYVFSIDLRPLKHSKILFSPEAMKNFVQITAAENFSELPGIASWVAFGLPRRIFGGYDVDYAGATIVSGNGRVMVETHDPPEILKREGKKHFLLQGKYMKIALRSSRYPFIASAPAMNEYVQGMLERYGAISYAKAEREKAERRKNKIKTGKKGEKYIHCQPPDL